MQGLGIANYIVFGSVAVIGIIMTIVLVCSIRNSRNMRRILSLGAKDFHDIMLEKTKVDVTVNVTYEGSYDDILNKITQGFAPGNIPSLAIAYPDHVANYLGIGKDKVYELGAFMNDPNIGFGTQEFLGDKKSGEVYDEEDFIEAYLDEGRQYAYEGLYSMPLMKSSEVLFYNADAVRKIIELIPDTFLPKASRLSPEAFIDSLSWDDLIEVCRFAVENKSKILGTLKQPLYYDSDGNLFISKMFQNGIPYTTIDEEHKGHIAFESGDARTKAEKMVNDLAKASKDGLLTLRKNNADKYGSTAFAAEECIFTVGSSGGAGYTQPEGEAFDYGVTRVPASNNNPLYVSQGPTMAILNNPTRPDGRSFQVHNEQNIPEPQKRSCRSGKPSAAYCCEGNT